MLQSPITSMLDDVKGTTSGEATSVLIASAINMEGCQNHG